MASVIIQTLGPYHLLEPIGQGAMSTVYKGYDPGENRNVAIKVLPPTLAQVEQFGRRFQREIRVVMQLEHPHIMPVVDFGEEGGNAYLVMPYLKSGTLAERLERDPLRPMECGRVIEQVSGALDYAHSEGVVHRDVKPSNILLDQDGNALLSDFGLAHISDASVSLTGSALIGTPAYMSPEQARGDPVDARSDQYSLGVILYQLTTGQLPFKAETPMALLVKHLNEPLPLPRSVCPTMPEPIEHVILKGTAKNPDDRFGSVAEMNQAFQASLAHAQDPQANPAPSIALPAAINPTQVAQAPQAGSPSNRSRWFRKAAIVVLLASLMLTLQGVSDVVLDALSRGFGPKLPLTATVAPIAVGWDATPTPSLTATSGLATKSPTPSPIPTQTPTTGPSPTATPTTEPSPTPALTTEPSPTHTATPTPTQPSATPTPTLTPTPTPTLTPTDTLPASPTLPAESAASPQPTNPSP